jgi:hypothetical protein
VCTEAVLISLAALGSSTGAVTYARLGTRAVRDINHRELTPDLQLSVERLRNSPNKGLLRVAHHGGPDIDEVELEIVVPAGGTEKVSIPQFGPGNRTTHASISSLRAGERQELTVLLSSYPTDRFTTLRVTCRKGRQRWTIVKDVAAPEQRHPAAPSASIDEGIAPDS